MSFAAQGDLEFLLPPDQLVPAVANLETVAPFRQQWSYNNWGYNVAGALIEKLSDKPFSQYLQEAVLDPLSLANTTTSPCLDDQSDFADAHVAYSDGTTHPVLVDMSLRIVFLSRLEACIPP
ncbi:beta-lactamase/transpeptidase-like protein [Stachybotrys elegans]|uniref:Beta-lactamase/transpeptidase-like protein n=1 Tax=Stachybotrys elegans TaxID=80388 RepID=A0A8K0T3M2_9HYPO|nr:beta-lactamase/transpeptidase-like protein [Stachybotrys elegans]